jgi:polyphosphate glucokinase
MTVLVVDVGGTTVKIAAMNQGARRKFKSGPTMTARQMIAGVKILAHGWKYDRISMGYPGVVKHNRPITEPHNLARGWVNFDYAAAFGCPVKIINDAAMQAVGSYKSGTMLFLGLGTGLGSALVVDGMVVPMELAHLPYRRSTYEYYLGLHGKERAGNKKWRNHVAAVVADLMAAFRPDDVVLGGGNSKRLKRLPKACRLGDNDNAFAGGFRLWGQPQLAGIARSAKTRAR